MGGSKPSTGENVLVGSRLHDSSAFGEYNRATGDLRCPRSDASIGHGIHFAQTNLRADETIAGDRR